MTFKVNIEQILGWVSEAGAIARQHFGRIPAEWKGTNNPVTAADREIEQLLTERLRAAYPDHGILGEEFGASDLDRSLVWAIDPIDGTRIYVEGLPTWSISVALLEDRRPVFGLIHLPLFDDWIYNNGDDVICNRVSVKGRLAQRWDPDSFVFWRSDGFSRWDLEFKRVVSYGASATHLSYTARGTSVATLVHDSYLWDIAAGAALLAIQGGEFRYADGSPLDFTTLDPTARIDGMYIGAHPAVIERLRPLLHARDAVRSHPEW